MAKEEKKTAPADVKPSAAFGWDDSVDPTNTGKQYTLLPEGEAIFTVMNLKRERKEFGKLGNIHVAVLTLMVSSVAEGAGDEKTEIEVQLGLHSDLSWKITDFFTCIGQRAHGDTGVFVPKWNEVEGAAGRCIIGHRKFTYKTGPRKGKEGTSNDITKFLAEGDEAEKPNPTGLNL